MTNLVTPGGAPLRPMVRDVREDRIRVCIVAMDLLLEFLAGKQILKCNGLPEGAELVGPPILVGNAAGGMGIALRLYHSSFPVVLAGTQPTQLVIGVEHFDYESVEIVDEPAPDA